MRRRLCRVTAITVCVLWLGSGAIAQQPADPVAPAAASQPVEITPDQFIKQLQDRYMALPSYSDRCTIRLSIEMQDADQAVTTSEMSWTTVTQALGKGQRRSECAGAVYIQDGETHTLAYPGKLHYTGTLDMMQSGPVNSKLAEVCTGTQLMGMFSPAMLLMCHPDGLESAFPLRISKIVSVKDELLNLVPCQRYEVMVSPSERTPTPFSFPTSIVVRKSDGMVVQVSVDASRVMKVIPLFNDGVTPVSGRIVADVTDIDTAAKIAPAIFDYKPAPTERELTRMDLQPFGSGVKLSHLDGVNLIGHAAPLFETTDQDGKPFKLADCQGKVTVLAFWGGMQTGTGMLTQVGQAVAGFKDKPVLAVGVNQSLLTPLSRIKADAAEAKADFAQIRDPLGNKSMRYPLEEFSNSGMVVIVDAKGQVADVLYDATTPEQLTAKIETVLAGKPVYDEAALAARREALEDQPDEMAPMFGLGMPDEEEKPLTEAEKLAILRAKGHFEGFNEAALIPADGPQLNTRDNNQMFFFSGMNQTATDQLIDINGDGRQELITCVGNRLCLLSSDGNTQTTVYRGEGNNMISSFEYIARGGVRRWIVASTGYGYMPQESDPATLNCINPEGELIWTYEFPSAGGYNITGIRTRTADLDADGKPEIVLSFSAMRLRDMGGNSFAHESTGNVLAVIDLDGNLIARKLFPQGDSIVPFVTAPNDPKQKPQILLIHNGGTTRLQLDRSRAKEKPTPMEVVADAYFDRHKPTPPPVPTPVEMQLPMPRG